MRQTWHSWMIASGVVHGTTCPPMRLDVMTWVDNAMVEMRREGSIIRNAWRKTGYEWFVGDDGVEGGGKDATNN